MAAMAVAAEAVAPVSVWVSVSLPVSVSVSVLAVVVAVPLVAAAEGTHSGCAGGGLFVITEALFVIRIHVFYRILPVFYTFPKTDRILQNTSRTHKNTQEYEHVEECERHIHRKCENTTEYRQNTASRWYSLRIHTEYGGLQNTTQEYRAEYARNTQKNTVFFIVFRIRQRIRYFTCRIPTSIAFVRLLCLQGPCRRLLDDGDRALLCVNWVAIPIQGLGHHLCFCHLSFCLAQLLGDCFSGDARPFAFFLCFPAALLVFFFSCRQWEVGVRERRSHMRGREDSMHCEL